MEEAKIQKLRAVEASLKEKIRAAHASLGTKTKKREILKQEEVRLRKVLSNDRSAIEDFTDQMKSIVVEERGRKNQFVTQMDSLNEELGDVLRRFEEGKLLETVISIESCKILREFVKGKIIEQKQNGGVDPANSVQYEIFNSVLKAVERLDTVTAKHREEHEGNKRLKDAALMSRNTFKLKGGFMGGKVSTIAIISFTILPY